MKVYYYLIIAVGIMLLFGLAGVETSSNHILRTFISTNNTAISPDTTASNPSSVNSVRNFTGSLWENFLVALLAIVVLVAVSKIQIGGFSLGGGIDRTVVLSALMYGLFGFIVQDLWSIVAYFFTLGTEWISWTVAVLMATFITGFAISIIEFTGGGD